MKTATTSQISAIHTLLGKAGLKDQKESIVSSFTAERTSSVGSMYKNEAAALIGHLKSLDPTVKKAEKMRNKIIGMAHDMQWHLPAEEGHPGTQRIDMERLNNWCIKMSYKHKKLDSYTYNELPRLVTQFEHVYKSFLKGLS